LKHKDDILPNTGLLRIHKKILNPLFLGKLCV